MKKWRELLFKNWGLKLISLSIAFALWFVVISINDPVDDKSFTNIRVSLTNTELLTDKGKIYEVLEGTNIVRSVSFEAPKSIREKIESGDIIAEADFNDMTSTDTVPIKFHCPKYGSDVTNISGNISYVKLNVEERVSKSIDIKYNLVGTVAEGYVISSVNLDQNRLEIVGPASKVAEVAKAVVDVNVTDISNDISTRGDIRLINADNMNLEYESVGQNADNVRVSVVVYATKEVPIRYTISGEPEDGYMPTGEMETTLDTVWVAGPGGVLNAVNEIVIPEEELDITGATESVIKDINLKRFLPTGMIFADKSFDGKVKVTVFIEEIVEEELEISNLNLQIMNKPINKVIEYTEGIEIPRLHIQGLGKDVSAVVAENLRGIIDVTAWMQEQGMEALPSGTYQIPVEFELPLGVEQMEPIVVSLDVMTPEEYANKARMNNAS